MKFAKDARVRKEWGSTEMILINDEYVPTPPTMAKQRIVKKPSTGKGKKTSEEQEHQSYSTSSSENDTEEELPHKDDYYESLVNKLEKKQGKVSKEDFTLISVIGSGSYGKVYLVRKISNQKIYAMKVLKKSFLREHKQIEHTWAERKILEKVNHPFIVKLKFAFQTTKKLFLILEYCAGGELFFYL